jgi:hypothetical protein
LDNIIPARPPEYNTFSPTSNWMHIAREVLDEILFGFTTKNGLRAQYSYFTKPLKYKDTEVVQVFFGNWTVHCQMSWHGTEEYDPNQRYGDLSEKILISLDVEAGGRKVPRIAKFQKYVLDKVAPVAKESLPESNVELVEHHLVWEAVDFNPYDRDSVTDAALKLAEYVTTLATPAVEAALEWGEEAGFEVQAMKPILRAS